MYVYIYYLFVFFCFIYIYRTTIKIPRSLLRQNGGENLDRHDKSPMQLALESELAKKREEDAAYEDVTEVSIPFFFFNIVVLCYFYHVDNLFFIHILVSIPAFSNGITITILSIIVHQ